MTCGRSELQLLMMGPEAQAIDWDEVGQERLIGLRQRTTVTPHLNVWGYGEGAVSRILLPPGIRRATVNDAASKNVRNL